MEKDLTGMREQPITAVYLIRVGINTMNMQRSVVKTTKMAAAEVALD